MRLEQLGSLQARITGGTDREGGGDGPVVILLHGYGAPGDDLVALWRVLDVPPSTRFVFPEAPLPLSHFGGRAWWHLDEARIERAMRGEITDRTDEVPDGLVQARDAILSLLDAVETRLAVPTSKVLLGGFSQGAMVSLDAALHSKKPLAGVALLSTTLIAAKEWTALMPACAGLPVFQSHGTSDRMLPYAFAEALRAHLEEAGLPVEFVSFTGAHEIPHLVLDRLGAFIRARAFPNS